MTRHLLSIADLTRKDIEQLLVLAKKIKQNPQGYTKSLQGKSLLMLFEKPSLRTRVSFEVGMTQLGGHAIYYDAGTSPFGKGKETIEDTARTTSRYVDLIMARVFEHYTLEAMAKHASVPVINALSNFSHPCQILSDLLTILEKKKTLDVKVAYLGDSNNNITHSWLFASSIFGFDLAIACPQSDEYMPQDKVLSYAYTAAKKSGASITVTGDPYVAVKDADIIYTDSWMSYHVKPEEKPQRIAALQKYQVNELLLKKANKGAMFMHCLPATRGEEVASSVMDGRQSIVFDQAENRLHMQKAVMLALTK